MMRLFTMGELTEGPDQFAAGRGFVVSGEVRPWPRCSRRSLSGGTFSWLRMTLHWHVTCRWWGHDWGSCAVLVDDGWILYWRCDRCTLTDDVERGLPAPRLLSDETKPPAYVR